MNGLSRSKLPSGKHDLRIASPSAAVDGNTEGDQCVGSGFRRDGFNSFDGADCRVGALGWCYRRAIERGVGAVVEFDEWSIELDLIHGRERRHRDDDSFAEIDSVRQCAREQYIEPIECTVQGECCRAFGVFGWRDGDGSRAI